jgi:hypothetical protein
MKIAILSNFAPEINKTLLSSLLHLDETNSFLFFCQERVDLIHPNVDFVINKDM